MKTFLGLVFCCSILVFLSACSPPTSASSASSATDPNPPPRLTVEMRDGSRVVGNCVDATVSVHSAAIGNLKLAWATIRSIEFAASTDAARLTATNGDGFAVQLDAATLRLETDFGKTELPVKMIRSIKVTPETKRKTNTATPAVNVTDIRLTIELRDGSHLVGKGLDTALNFHSASIGDLKLTWAGIRSVIFASDKSPTARLTTTNGDAYEVEFVTSAVRVETSFGKTELPAKSIRSIKVSAVSGRGQLPAGLVALWSGEGDGTDSVGGNTAMLTDITFAEGKVGQAFSFNGTTSTIKIPASPALDVGAGDGFTITAWIKPTQIDGIHPLLQWSEQNMLNLWIGIRPFENGVLRGDITDGAGNHFVVSRPNTLVNGVFQHIAFTYDKASGSGTLYVNGVTVAQRQLGTQLVAHTKGDLWLSQIERSPGNMMTDRAYAGLMDEIAIYNRALSAEEIQSICTAENHGEPLVTPAPSTGWYESWMR